MDANGVISAAYDADSRALRVTGLDGTYAPYPEVIDLDPFMTWQVETNWGNRVVDTACLKNGYRQGTVQNSALHIDVPIGAGTWTVEVMTFQASDAGIITVYFDSTSVGTLDGYNAVATRNVRASITGIVIATSAVRTLKLVMETKNASSSGYKCNLQGVRLLRTA